MVDKTIDPLNSWGKDFWKRHLKCLFFLKYISAYLVDLLSNQFKFTDLTFLSMATYVMGLDPDRLGIYVVYPGCQAIEKYYVINYRSSDPWELTGDLSIYLHNFIPLIFIGNHAKSPYMISVACGLLSLYDTVVRLIDISYCSNLDADYQSLRLENCFAVLRMTVSAWCLACWLSKEYLVVLFVREENRHKFSLIRYFGLGMRYIWVSVLCCNRFRNTRRVLNEPFVYPMRIQIATVFSVIIIGISTATILVISYGIYYTIQWFEDYDDYLASFPDDSIFTIISINDYNYTYLIGDIRSVIKWCIKLLEPIFPLLAIGYTIGSLVVIASILNLFYIFKFYFLKLKELPRDSAQLKWLWNFAPHSALSFTGQFVFGNMFLQYMVVLTVFVTGYTATLLYYVGFELDQFILNRSNTFWIGLVPVIVGTFYFPRFTDERNYLKNKRWPALWDSWYLLVGLLGSVIKGATRYILAVVFTLISGFQIQVSAFPAPYHFYDTLYKSFYSTLVVECLNQRIVPEFAENEKPRDYGDLQIYLFQNDL